MKTLRIAFALALISTISYGQTGDVRNYGKFRSDLTPLNYDSLLNNLHERNASESYERFYNEFINFDPSSVDMSGALSDEIYSKRLKMMATEIQLPYNEVVKSYLVLYSKKPLMERILGRAQYYFPIFEEALYRHNLPMEFKILPVIESALIPSAKSHASAVGLWQFIVPTAKYYGLEINSFVDERCDPIKSTEAACRHLKDLYRMYGDWTLVIAAYNCGPGNVNKALAKVPNATNYWEIYDYLPRETRGYMPAFIAATYAYTYHKAHGMQPTPIQIPLATDTVMVDRMMHFDQITNTINVPTEVLRELNPQYRQDIIPATASKYSLVLPQSEMSRYIQNETDIFAKDTMYLAKYLNVTNLSDAAKAIENRRIASSASASGRKTPYKVKSGDTLGSIARRHGVKVAQIQKWNNIRGTNIRAGQTLYIYK